VQAQKVFHSHAAPMSRDEQITAAFSIYAPEGKKFCHFAIDK
jgi:hypothetical protein